MPAQSTVFPAFIREEYQPGGGFAQFERAAGDSGTRAGRAMADGTRRAFERDFADINRMVSAALARPAGKAGGLDLGVGEMRQAATAAQAHAQALRQVARAAELTAREQGDNSAATRRYLQAARAAVIEADRGAREANEQAVAMERLQTQLDRAAGSAQRLAGANGRLAASNDNSRMGMVGVGQQLQDITIGLQSGQRASTVFAQQLPQLAFAMSNFGGVAGRVGAFLSGPWGAAILAGTLLLGGMAAAFGDSEEAADKAGDANDRHRRSAEDLAKAIRELDEATEEQTRTSRQSAQASLDNAKALLQEAIQTRENVIAQLELAAARLNAAESPTQRGALYGGAGAAAEVGSAAGEVRALRARIAEQQELIAAAERSVRRLSAPVLEQQIAERMDEAAAATGEYERAIGRLREQLAAGGIDEAEYARQFEAAARRKEAALERIQKAEQAARRSGRGPDSSLSANDIAADVDARLRAIGATITSGYRDPEHNRRVGGAVNSYHLSNQARDIAKTAGVTLASIREALAGLDIVELIDKGDHFHVAWTGALRGVSREAKEAERAARELDQALAATIRQFDPAAAATAEYAEALERIARLEEAGRITADQAGEYADAARQARYAALRRIEEQRRAEVTGQLSERLQAAMEGPIRDIGEMAEEELSGAAERSADVFRTAWLGAVDAIGSAIGGAAGGALGDIVALLGGNYGGAGRFGPLLAALMGNGSKLPERLELPGGGSIRNEIATLFENPFAIGLKGPFESIAKGLDYVAGEISDALGRNGALAEDLGRALGGGVLGYTLGSALGGNPLGSALGGGIGAVLGKKLGEVIGKEIGGAIGEQFGGPIGEVVGSVAGSLLGGLIGGPRKASATLTGPNSMSVRGKSGLLGDAEGLGSSVLTGLQRIADALGVSVGSFAVSIGRRGDSFRVDPAGGGQTKHRRVKEFNDAGSAIAFAILDAVKDGALQGLRASTRRLIEGSKDIEMGLEKALRFESVFTRLKEYVDPVGAALENVNREFEQLRKVFEEAGASAEEFAKLEELYQRDREEALKQATERTIGSLKSLLADLGVGNPALSLRDRLELAEAEYDPLAARIRAGETVDYDAFAEAARNLLEIERALYGSQGGYFSSLGEVRELTSAAMAREQAKLDAAEASAPVVTAIDRLEETMAGILNGHLGAVNQNLGRLIELARGGSASVQGWRVEQLQF